MVEILTAYGGQRSITFMEVELHPKDTGKAREVLDPLVFMFKAIEQNVLLAQAQVEDLWKGASPEVRQFLTGAKEIHKQCASLAREAALSVEEAELRVSRCSR